MTTKSATRNGIIHGGLENGMIDRNTKRYPDFDAMLAPCKFFPTQEEYQLCVDSFLSIQVIFRKWTCRR